MPGYCHEHDFESKSISGFCPYCEIDKLNIELNNIKLERDAFQGGQYSERLLREQFEKDNIELKKMVDFLATGLHKISTLVNKKITKEEFIMEAIKFSKKTNEPS